MTRHLRTYGARIMTFLFLLVCASLPAAAQNLSANAKPTTADDHAAHAARTSASADRLPAGEYIVGEGDLLRINVWKEPEMSQNVAVRPDGNVSLPLVNEVHLSGLSISQAQNAVTEKLKTVLTNPQVTVSVVEVRSKMVYITGEVGKPGGYSVVAPLNVLQLIARAGGLTEFAHRKDIYVLRNSQTSRLHFNYKEVIKGKNPAQNISLQPGDTVVVP
jgi:polysaccharide export outer membrane protein